MRPSLLSFFLSPIQPVFLVSSLCASLFDFFSSNRFATLSILTRFQSYLVFFQFRIAYIVLFMYADLLVHHVNDLSVNSFLRSPRQS